MEDLLNYDSLDRSIYLTVSEAEIYANEKNISALKANLSTYLRLASELTFLSNVAILADRYERGLRANTQIEEEPARLLVRLTNAVNPVLTSLGKFRELRKFSQYCYAVSVRLRHWNEAFNFAAYVAQLIGENEKNPEKLTTWLELAERASQHFSRRDVSGELYYLRGLLSHHKGFKDETGINFTQAYNVFEAQGNKEGMIVVLKELAQLDIEVRNIEQALNYLETAKRYAVEIGSEIEESECNYYLGLVYLKFDDAASLANAFKLFNQVVQFATQEDNLPLKLLGYNGLVHALEKDGQTHEAYSYAQKAVKLEKMMDGIALTDSAYLLDRLAVKLEKAAT